MFNGLLKKSLVVLVSLLVFTTIPWKNIEINPVYAASVDSPNENGANGSAAKPYIINEKDDFSWLISNYGIIKSGYLLQTADIDLTGFAWTPLGDSSNPFTGVFNGNGHTISNLTVNNGTLTYAGMFGYVGTNGKILNLTLSNVNITAGQSAQANIGAFAGMNAAGTIERCHVTGVSSITGIADDDYVGGIAGSSGGYIKYCSNSAVTQNDAGTLAGATADETVAAGNAQVTSSPFTGGIAGINYGTIENCYNRGNLNIGNIGISGGITGQNYGSNPVIRNCYSTGAITITTTVDTKGGIYYANGAIIGITASTSNITGNYYLTGSAGNAIGEVDSTLDLRHAVPSNDGAAVQSDANLKQPGTYSGWTDFTTNWTFDAGINNDYPILKQVPVIAATTPATNLSLTAATSGGSVTSNGKGTVSEWGIEYAKSSDPTLLKSSITSGDPSSFTIGLSGLIPSTEYYTRAYAVNEVGTSYGEPVCFTTLPTAPLLSVVISPGSILGSTQVIISGTATSKFVVNITDASVGYVATTDSAPTSGANFTDNYISGSDITNGVLSGKYLQVYDVGADGKVVKFYEVKLLAGQIKRSALTLPISEGFENVGNMPDDWASSIVVPKTIGTEDMKWTISGSGIEPIASPHSGAYMIKSNSYEVETIGASARLSLMRDFSIPASGSYEFSFWMYHSSAIDWGPNDLIQPQISTDGGATWSNLGASIMRVTGVDGWVKHTLSLDAYTGSSAVRVGLLAVSDYGYYIYVDDIEIKRLILPGKTLLADTNANSVDNDIEITFATDADFEAAITGVSFNGNVLAGGQYTVGSGKVTLKPSVAGNTYLRTPATGDVVIITEGYNDSTVSQIITAGAATSLTVTAQPNPGTASGDVFSTQPVVTLKDQYGNICSDGPSASANVNAAAKAGTGTWTIGGTTTKPASAGVATFTDLTCSLTSPGNGAITFTSGSFTIDSNTFTLPLKNAIFLTSDSTSNNVDNDIEITFAADPAFEAAITSVSFNGHTLAAGQYVVGSGKMTLKPSVTGNTYLRTPATSNVTIAAAGYNNSSVSQTITAGAAASLTVTTQPVPGLASGDAFTTQPIITLKDQYGNICSDGPSASANVNAAAKSGSGTWTIGGTTVKPASAGVAAFTDLTCSLTSPGNGAITFTSGPLTVESNTFTLPLKGAISLTADTTVNDVDHDIEITFTADPDFEAVITGVSFNGHTLATGQYAVGSGKVTLKPSVAGNTYLRTPAMGDVVIVAEGYNDSTISQTITAGAAASLTITTQPAPGTASGDAFATQPVIKLKDQYGNICTSGPSASADITALAKAGTGTWTIGGITVKPASAGVAAFTDLTCTLTSPGNGAITFTSGPLTVESNTFTLPLKDAISLTADTTANNVDSDIEITFTADAAFEAAITGVSFNGHTLAGAQYAVGSGKVTLKPSVAGNTYLRTPATSNVVIAASGYNNSSISQTITAGAAASLTVTTQPVPGTASGDVFTTQPVITLKDQYGNTCSDGLSASANVTAAAKVGTGTWTIGGTTVKPASAGVVTFTDLTCSLTSPGNGAITFTSGSLTVDSNTFTLPLKNAISLTADTTANSVDNDIEITFAADPDFEAAITALSFNGNVLTAGQYAVGSGKVSLKPSVAGNTYLRTPSFGDVIITAEGYNDSTVSQTITAGAAASLTIIVQPAPGTTSGDIFASQPFVMLKDQYGNVCTSGPSASADVIATAKAGTGTWTIGGTTVKPASTGVAAFTNLTCSLTSPGNGAITFTSGSLTIDSNTFIIPWKGAVSLTRDTTNNNVDNDIEITFAADPDFEAAITSVSFNGHTLAAGQYTVGSGKVTLKPSITGNTYLRTPAVGNVMIVAEGYNDSTILQIINAGAAASLTVITQPVPGTASGNTFATQPVVMLKDQYGNTCTDGLSSLANVTAAAKAGTGTWTIGGTTVKPASLGVVTFTNLTCSLTSPGNGAITFTSGSLTADSNTFTLPLKSAISLTADTTVNNVDHDIEITFSADPDFEAAITGVSFNGHILAAGQYTVGSGKVTLKPSVDGNTYLRTPVTGNVVITAAGYNNSTVSQTITAGTAASLNVSQDILTPAANGGKFARQPKVTLRDTYGNVCTSDNTTIISVSKKDTGTWTLTGTLTVSAIGGIATFTDLGATNAQAITGAQLAFNAPGLAQVTSNLVNLPAPPSPPSDPYSPPNNEEDGTIDIISDGFADVDTNNTDDKTVTTVVIEDEKLNEKLDEEGNGSKVIISVDNDSDVVVGQLNGQTVENMENMDAILEIKTENVTYTLPASQINIEAVADQIGSGVDLKDIKVSISIAEPPEDTVRIIEDTANKGNFQIVVKPLEFSISCTYGDQTVEVSKFNSYVERMVAIPEGVDPSKITTGIVLNRDGTFSHVPTTIIIVDGKYYAKINSLTNSTYSVIYSPKTFSDIQKHWGKTYIEDMASRLVMEGTGKGTFEPDKAITRAEFTDAVVKSLGLARSGSGSNIFKDVDKRSRYYDSISTAYQYKIVAGTGGANFQPDRKITRQEAMTILINAMLIAQLNLNITDKEIAEQLTKFKDAGSISAWAKKAVALCIREGILEGSNGKFLPVNNITRAETATVVQKMLKKAKLI